MACAAWRTTLKASSAVTAMQTSAAAPVTSWKARSPGRKRRPLVRPPLVGAVGSSADIQPRVLGLDLLERLLRGREDDLRHRHEKELRAVRLTLGQRPEDQL